MHLIIIILIIIIIIIIIITKCPALCGAHIASFATKLSGYTSRKSRSRVLVGIMGVNRPPTGT